MRALTLMLWLLVLLCSGCGWLLPDLGVQPPDLAQSQDSVADLVTDAGGDLPESEDFVLPPQETWTGDLPLTPPWNCPVSLEALAAEEVSGSFAREGLVASVNMLSVYYSQCGEAQSLPGPETPFILRPAVASRLELRLDCPPPCRAYLFREGCYYQNFQACWNETTGVLASPAMPPGTWVLALEQPLLEGLEAPPAARLHAALTPLEPPKACPPDSTLAWSTLPEVGEDRQTSLRLCLPAQGPDRLKSACAEASDAFGGMPEYLLELQPDLAEAGTAELTLDIQPEASDSRFFASLGGPGCGPGDFGCKTIQEGGSASFQTLVFQGSPLRLRLEGDSRQVFPLREQCFQITVRISAPH